MSDNQRYYPEYDKISIIVYTENSKEKQKYFNLFYFMFKDKIEKTIDIPDRKEFFTDKLHFRFFTKLLNARGYKAHYVLNLTQDEEFHNCVAIPNTSIHEYLRKDVKWFELFYKLD